MFAMQHKDRMSCRKVNLGKMDDKVEKHGTFKNPPNYLLLVVNFFALTI